VLAEACVNSWAVTGPVPFWTFIELGVVLRLHEGGEAGTSISEGQATEDVRSNVSTVNNSRTGGVRPAKFAL
jgi:hypothetical protein